MASVRRALASNRLVRQSALGAYRLAARGVFFLPPPPVLATSLAKSGTHLLTSLLDKLPRMMAAGIHRSLGDFQSFSGEGAPGLDEQRLRRTLRAVHNGQFMSAHFPADPRLRQMLEQLRFKTVLIVRDPRDVVVSHTSYVTRTPRHHHHARYREMRDDDERLLASITGFPGFDGTPGLESIGSRLSRYEGWLEDPRAYVCRFENLVGPRGGGSREQQLRHIAGVAHHLQRDLSPQRLESVAARVWSSRSATFRKGRTGEWRDRFNAAHVEEFERVAGRYLERFGYE